MLGWALGILGAGVIILLAWVAYRTHRWFIRSVAPAASVLVLGAFLLLGTGQGRDLGSALLSAERGQQIWFAMALLYWALATWHSARFPLDRAHAQWLEGPPRRPSEAGRRRRSWTPRLMGGLVFGFALAHVGWALWWGDGRLDEARLPAALILAAAVLYWLFVVYRRPAGQVAGGRLAQRAPTLAERLDALFAAQPDGAGDEELTTRTAMSTKVAFFFFFLVGFVLALLAFGDPQAVGERFGSMALAFFALGGFLAGLVGLWQLSERGGMPLPAAVAALLFVALVVSFTRHYHPVRDCAGLAGCLEGEALAEARRSSVADAAVAWHEQAKALVPEGEPVPMIVVATAGGGLRAAYWTAVVLGALPDELDLSLGDFERLTFAISGVSGGSVGAAFRTALAPEHQDAAALDQAVRAALTNDFLAPTLASLAFVDLPSWVLPKWRQTTRGVALEQAFEAAAPSLATPFLAARRAGDGWRPLLFLNATHQETGRRVIAGHVRIDRDPFLDSFDIHELMKIDLRLGTAAHNSARFTYVSPAGRLAEHDTDEDRGWIIDGGYFENFGALTALDVVRAAVAAIGDDKVRPVIIQISSDPELTARITHGAGERRDRAGLGELVACGAAAREEGGASTSSPSPDRVSAPLPYDEILDREGWLPGNQLLAPLRGIMGSREAHGITASKELASFACTRKAAGLPVQYAHFAMCETASPPLGWVLSAGARRAIEAYLGECENAEEMRALHTAFGGAVHPTH